MQEVVIDIAKRVAIHVVVALIAKKITDGLLYKSTCRNVVCEQVIDA